MRCALGRSGIVAEKREGDGGTPIGAFPIRRIFYRPDREAAPRTALPLVEITPNMGWCDAPGHTDYNRLVQLPHSASCESLWRDDGVYDLIGQLGHNDDPIVPGMGSAIFLHLIKPGYLPTEGCVALARDDLLVMLAQAKPGDRLVVTDD